MPPTVRDEKLEALREQLWPDSKRHIWKSTGEKGYFCAPRTLPLLLRLMNDKAIMGSIGDCGQVYIDLFSRVRGPGIVEVVAEGDHAYCSGYVGSRAKRSWRERVAALERAGFIQTKSKPNQPIAFVLLVHPHLVVERLKAEGKISHEWLESYAMALREHGATVPDAALTIEDNVVPMSRAHTARRRAAR